MTRGTMFGAPFRLGQEASKVSVQIVEPKWSRAVSIQPTAGFDLSDDPADLRPGETPFSENFMMREGGLELRPTLTSYLSNPQPLPFVTGCETIVSSVDSHFPIASGATEFAFYSQGSWSRMSYVSSAGSSFPPSGTTQDYYDIVQTYEPGVDDMIAVMACQSYQTLFCWVSGATIFSSITGAPRAAFVADYDNFVLAFNVRDVGSAESKYNQRIQWSDRGAPLTWSFGGESLAGFEDLLDAKGAGTRVMRMDDRVILFFEDEIWQGVRATGNSSFAFSPYDRTIGCPYSYTIAVTPLGLMFLARDNMVYLLPKGGGACTPIGYPVRRQLQNRIDAPEKSWAVYDPDTRQYRLYYPVIGGTGLPQESLWINIGENSWAVQSYVHAAGSYNLTRGFISYNDETVSSISWGAATFPWDSTLSTWADFAVVSGQFSRRVAAGTSDGSLYVESDGTMDGAIPVTATWRSGALGGDSPRNMKVLQEVRCDYTAILPSTLTIQCSRDVGATFDPAVSVPLPIAPFERNVVGHTYTVAQYPLFQVQSSSNAVRLFRFQTQYTVGGSSA